MNTPKTPKPNVWETGGYLLPVKDLENALALGANPNRKKSNGDTPLHYACAEGVAVLIKHGANPNAQNRWGQTPLHHAYGPKADVLLRSGANPEIAELDGSTPLHVAAQHFSSDRVETLLKHGANPNAVDNDGKTPLHLCSARNSDNEKAELLCQFGADVNKEDKHGETPLSAMGPNIDTDVLRTILANGANPFAKNRFGQTLYEQTNSSRWVASENVDALQILKAAEEKKTLLDSLDKPFEACQEQQQEERQTRRRRM